MNIRSTRPRSVLALGLALVLVAGHLPAAADGATAGPRNNKSRFYVHGEQLFRLDYEGSSEEGAALPDHGGFSAVLHRGVYPSSRSEREWQTRGFTFEEGPGTTPFEQLGSGALDSHRRADREGPPSRWEEVVRWTVNASADTVTSTFRAGVDWISVTLPREVVEAGESELPEDAIITVEANGIETRLDRARIDEIRAARACGGSETTPSEARALRDTADSFVDLPRFLNHVRGYLEIERQARIRQALDLLPTEEEAESSSCATLCFSCAGALLASVGAYVALVSTCGGTLVTGGTTAVLCVASFIGVQSSHLIVFASCARCVECAGDPGCPCEGEPLCDCG